MKIEQLRNKFWKKFVNQPNTGVPNWNLGEAINDFYKKNKDKVFRGNDGFTFIKNEVFGSSDELFTDLYNSIYPLLK